MRTSSSSCEMQAQCSLARHLPPNLRRVECSIHSTESRCARTRTTDHQPGISPRARQLWLAASRLGVRVLARVARAWTVGVLQPHRAKANVRALFKRGMIALSKTLDHAGPMCRHFDCALFLDAMKGYDLLDPCKIAASSSDMPTAPVLTVNRAGRNNISCGAVNAQRMPIEPCKFQALHPGVEGNGMRFVKRSHS